MARRLCARELAQSRHDARPSARVRPHTRGEHDQAIAVARDVLRREPENRDAWGLLLGFVSDKRSPLAQRARAELRRLSPLEVRR